jgi:uncharacterized repeat protein (TIGR01451 family)
MKNLCLLLVLFSVQFVIAQNDSLVNGNFESGDFTGWELFEGEVSVNSFEMVNIVPVTPPSIQHAIDSVSDDPIIGAALPRVYPNGGLYSAELGDGNGTGGQASRIKQIFLVDSIDNALAYHFSLVMESPQGHTLGEMPFFSARIIDQNGDTIYNNEVTSLDVNSGGDPDFIAYAAGVYLPWTTNYVDLSDYVGEYVTLEFTSGDCAQSGHYGYAYVEAESVTPTTCMFTDFEFKNVFPIQCGLPGNVEIEIINGEAPYTYNWSNGDTSSAISPTTPGLYTLVLTDSSGCTKERTVIVNGYDYLLGFDLEANLHSGAFRVGQSTRIDLAAFNNGCDTVLGQLKLVLDDLVSYSSGSPTPTINGDTLTWDLPQLAADSIGYTPYVYVVTSTSANIGDTVCFDIEVTPIAGDVDTTNNFKHYCKTVVNSYDPNYKAVYPQGECEPNYVLSNQKLTYTVHFQNTGTAPAININILDTLHTSLDINTVRVVAQSHEGLITEVVNGNTLDFRFDGINLADSASDESVSHGYVIFEVQPINNIVHDRRVENKVGIYFDYNEPITTNTVFNTFVDSIPHQETILNETTTTSFELNGVIYDSSGTYTQEFYSAVGCDSVVVLNLIVTPTGVQDVYNKNEIVLYPNPISSILNIEGLDGLKNYEIIIYNTLGEVVFKGVNNKEVNFSNLPQGLYSLKLKSGEMIVVKKILKQ